MSVFFYDEKTGGRAYFFCFSAALAFFISSFACFLSTASCFDFKS